MVGKKRRVLVTRALPLLEPFRESGVQTPPPGFGNTRVRDVACQRVLHRVLGFPRHRGPGAPANEVPTLEEREIGLLSLQQMPYRTRTKRPTDHRSRLQTRLLLRREPIQSRGEHRVHAVRNGEVGRELADRPRSVLSFENSRVDELAEKLLQEERVAFRALDEQVTEGLRHLDCEQLVHEPGGLGRRERLEPERRCVPPTAAPVRAAVEKLRPGGRENNDRRLRLVDNPFEQVEQVVFSPVDVLDQQGGGAPGGEFLDELDDRCVQALPGIERMQTSSDVAPESEGEYLSPLEPPSHLLG